MFKLCVFDMDGTVIDSLGDIAAAMNRSLEKIGELPYPVEKYKKMVGDGMEILCRRALKDEKRLKELVSLYKADYLKNCCVNSKVYPNMGELIKKLAKGGVKCAVLSNKPHNQVKEIAEKLLDCEDYYEIMGQSERFPIKPAPDALLYLMEKAGADRNETVYIGDSNVDIKFGKAAGVFSIGAAWGFRGEEELLSEGADAVAKDAYELEKILFDNR